MPPGDDSLFDHVLQCGCPRALYETGKRKYVPEIIYSNRYRKLKLISENGCKSPKGTEMAVGAVEQDEKTCGALTCQNTEGDAFIH